MSREIATPQGDTVLLQQLEAQVEALQDLVGRRQTQKSGQLEHARRNLEGAVRDAARMKTEYEELLEAYRGVLEKIAALDVQTLREFRSFNNLGDVAEEAKRTLVALAAAVRVLEEIPNRVAAISIQAVEQGVPGRIMAEIADHAGGPSRTLDKIKEWARRMRSFEEAQRL
jgi:hypothetical protein